MYFITSPRLDYKKGKQMHIWIDIETTGLDPEHDKMLEIAWFTTDRALNQLTTPETTFLHNDYTRVHELLSAEPYVLQMHTTSGLLAEMSNAYAGNGNTMLTLEDAEDAILRDMDVAEASEEFDGWVLAGASVHFDRSFIAKYMPRLNKRMSHRHLDVSTLRMMMAASNVGYPYDTMGANNHRALYDIITTHNTAVAYYEYVSATVPIMLAKSMPPKETN